MIRLGISKNPNNSISDQIKQRLIKNPVALNVDQIDNGVQTAKFGIHLYTEPRIQILLQSNKVKC